MKYAVALVLTIVSVGLVGCGKGNDAPIGADLAMNLCHYDGVSTDLANQTECKDKTINFRTIEQCEAYLERVVSGEVSKAYTPMFFKQLGHVVRNAWIVENTLACVQVGPDSPIP